MSARVGHCWLVVELVLVAGGMFDLSYIDKDIRIFRKKNNGLYVL